MCLCECFIIMCWCIDVGSFCGCMSDLLHILSFLPKDMNFVHHSSYIGWKE